MRTVAMGLVLVLSIVVGALGEETAKPGGAPADAREILKKAAEAMKKVDVATYDADYRPVGWLTSEVPSASGKVVIGKQSKLGVDRFFCEVKLQPPGSSETLEFTAGCNGDLFFVIDPKTKTAYQDMDPAVMGSNSRGILRVVQRDFAAREPLADQLKVETVELGSPQKVGDEECDEVVVKRSGGAEIRWCFSKKDVLPRRVERVFKNEKGETGSTVLSLSRLVVNPSFAKDPFALVVPEGYKKTDDFAP